MSSELAIDQGALGGLERTIGFLLSLAATILGTWVVANHQTTTSKQDFAQARRIAIVATAIFTALMFVFLAGPGRFMELGIIAVGGLVACFAFFLWNVAVSFSARRSGALVVVTYLATFIIYAASGSVALSATGLLLYVADPTGAKSQIAPIPPAALGASLAPNGSQPTPRPVSSSPSVALTDLPAAASVTDAGTFLPSSVVARVARPATAATIEYEVRAFEASSGPVNFGCEESRPARAQFSLPEKAEVIGALSASWRNVSNAHSFSTSPPQSGSSRLVVEGVIVGQAKEHILGIANCPGGGHGELVLSGSYRRPKWDVEKSGPSSARTAPVEPRTAASQAFPRNATKASVKRNNRTR